MSNNEMSQFDDVLTKMFVMAIKNRMTHAVDGAIKGFLAASRTGLTDEIYSALDQEDKLYLLGRMTILIKGGAL